MLKLVEDHWTSLDLDKTKRPAEWAKATREYVCFSRVLSYLLLSFLAQLLLHLIFPRARSFLSVNLKDEDKFHLAGEAAFLYLRDQKQFAFCSLDSVNPKSTHVVKVNKGKLQFLRPTTKFAHKAAIPQKRPRDDPLINFPKSKAARHHAKQIQKIVGVKKSKKSAAPSVVGLAKRLTGSNHTMLRAVVPSQKLVLGFARPNPRSIFQWLKNLQISGEMSEAKHFEVLERFSDVQNVLLEKSDDAGLKKMYIKLATTTSFETYGLSKFLEILDAIMRDE